MDEFYGGFPMRARALFCIFVAMALAGCSQAQTFTGGLRGAVRDANGVSPASTVELVNEATGSPRKRSRTIRANTTSRRFQPGTYTIKATLTGFKTYENKGVRISAQQFITLDIPLEVGQLQETITVTGAVAADRHFQRLDRRRHRLAAVAALPSGGRSAFLFAVTVPTVVASGDAQFNRQQDQTNASLLSLGGGTRRGNNYLVDGVPVTDMRNRASANPSIEALEEVNVQLHHYDAETGRTGGGTFNVADQVRHQ